MTTIKLLCFWLLVFQNTTSQSTKPNEHNRMDSVQVQLFLEDETIESNKGTTAVVSVFNASGEPLEIQDLPILKFFRQNAAGERVSLLPQGIAKTGARLTTPVIAIVEIDVLDGNLATTFPGIGVASVPFKTKDLNPKTRELLFTNVPCVLQTVGKLQIRIKLQKGDEVLAASKPKFISVKEPNANKSS